MRLPCGSFLFVHFVFFVVNNLRLDELELTHDGR